MTNPEEIKEKSKAQSFKAIDRSISTMTAEMEQEDEATLLAATQSARVERLLKIYGGIKPLLTVLTVLPIIPEKWRAALALFNNAIEAMAVGGADATFKAGKDL